MQAQVRHGAPRYLCPIEHRIVAETYISVATRIECWSGLIDRDLADGMR
jgi:hypothetical protein